MTAQEQITEQHRQAQVALRTRALRDFAVLWPLWRLGDGQSFQRLVAATVPLIGTYNQISANVAGAYYESFRQAQDVKGTATVQLAAVPAEAQIAASLYATGEAAARDALAAGRSPQAVQQVALVRTSGAIGRHILDGGRNTILQTVQKDDRAVGWYRITDGNPCAFCLTLASRGAVYKSEQSADFQAHDHCGCMAQAKYEGSKLPDSVMRFRKIYDAAQRQAVEAGDLHPGENTPSARINAVRRYLATAQ